MPKFFLKNHIFEGVPPNDLIPITGADMHHILHVLRLSEADEVTLCDGRGIDYKAAIHSITKDAVYLKIVDITRNAREPEIKITLFQGLPKGDKLSLIVEKCVEAGVTEIVPVLMERTVVKTDSDKFFRKADRLNKISESAAKQSGRGIIPTVGQLINFNDMLKRKEEFGLFLFPYELEDKTTLKQVLSSRTERNIALVIGPEGGFSGGEADKIRGAGIIPVSLGPRILRTETAGFAAIFNILYEYEL